MNTHKPARRRVAVIGSGVSGLTAAHVLHRHDDVTLFEADDRPGGHAHTHRVPGRDGSELGVDSGFIVHNRRTYPHLLRLFEELGVTTRPTEMSLSVSCEGCGLEYAGARGLRGALVSGRGVAAVAEQQDGRKVVLLRVITAHLAQRLVDLAEPSPGRAEVKIGGIDFKGRFVC